MKFKVDSDGKVEIRDGQATLIAEDGTESKVDAAPLSSLLSTVGKVRQEREEWKGRAEALDAELRKIGRDADARSKVLDLAKKAQAFDEKKLVEAGEIDKVVSERTKKMAEDHAAEIALLRSEVSTKDASIRDLGISSVFKGVREKGRPFDGSKYLITQSAIEALFSKHLTFENGRIVAYKRLPGTNGKDDSGEKVYNSQGELASPDEALSILRDAHPEKAQWEISVATGGGAPGGAPGKNGSKTLTVEQFHALQPAARMKFVVEEGGTVI